eukprot:Skav215562  [mRNA]  locus=scaffold1793:61949:69217:- [translate_table: standard]
MIQVEIARFRAGTEGQPPLRVSLRQSFCTSRVGHLLAHASRLRRGDVRFGYLEALTSRKRSAIVDFASLLSSRASGRSSMHRHMEHSSVRCQARRRSTPLDLSWGTQRPGNSTRSDRFTQLGRSDDQRSDDHPFSIRFPFTVLSWFKAASVNEHGNITE